MGDLRLERGYLRVEAVQGISVVIFQVSDLRPQLSRSLA
jgi:hypothetical protein